MVRYVKVKLFVTCASPITRSGSSVVICSDRHSKLLSYPVPMGQLDLLNPGTSLVTSIGQNKSGLSDLDHVT